MGVGNSVKTREVIVRNVHKELYHLGPVFYILLSKTHIFKVTGSLAFDRTKTRSASLRKCDALCLRIAGAFSFAIGMQKCYSLQTGIW